MQVQKRDGPKRRGLGTLKGKRKVYKKKPICAMRYFVAVMVGFGLFQVYSMRVNLSVAVQPMACQYQLSNPTTGFILSSFFWGYILGQIPGGYLSVKYGGKLVFGIGVFCTSICTLLLPYVTSNSIFANLDGSTNCQCGEGVAKEWSFSQGHFRHHKDDSLPICDESPNLYLLFVLRVLTGLFEAPSYPAFYYLVELWAPEDEKSFILALGNSGAYLGTLCAFPLSSYILVSSQWFGYWPYVFYVFGILGLIWTILWFLLVPDSPQSSRAIHPLERELILSDKNTSDINNIPWKMLLTHKAFWANYCAHISFNWVLYTLLTYLPTYLNKRLDFDMTKSGFLTSGPYIGLFIGSIFIGKLADQCIKRKWMERHQSRKVFQMVSFLFSGSCLATLGFVNHKILSVVLVICAQAFACITQGGFSSNYLDVSKEWIGPVYGIGNFLGTIPGIISPILTGFILGTDSGGSQHDWIEVFLIGTVVSGTGTILFVLLSQDKPPFSTGYVDLSTGSE